MAVFYITQVKLIFNKQIYKANFISFSTIHWQYVPDDEGDKL